MIEQYTDITRKWAKGDDKSLELQREYMALQMRHHYFTLDPCVLTVPNLSTTDNSGPRSYVRGRTVYHRCGRRSHTQWPH
jgi:hypothetical protein